MADKITADQTTEVGLWLADAAVGFPELTKKFYDLGFRSLEDLEVDDIDTVPDLQTGTKRALKRLLQAKKGGPAVHVNPDETAAKATELGKWLEGVGEPKAVLPFYQKGYKYIMDLTDAVVTQTLGASAPGSVSIIIRKLAEEKAKSVEGVNETEAKSTEVGKWLTKHGIEAQFIKGFYAIKCTDMSSVTDKVIDQVIPRPADVIVNEKLKRLIKEANEALPKGPNIPTLPAGTKIDLSKASVDIKDFGNFKIPTDFSVMVTQGAANGKVVEPLTIEMADWIHLFRNSRLVCAYTMEDFTDGTIAPQASEMILDWKQPESDSVASFVIPYQLQASDTFKFSYTETSAAYTRAGIDKASATFSFPFVSGSSTASHQHNSSDASIAKTMHAFAIKSFPRAEINIDKCTAASDGFVKAVEAAMKEVNDNAKLAALTAVFKRYGVAIPRKVMLGGRFLGEKKRQATGEANEASMKLQIQAAVEGAYKTASGGASVEHQNAQTTELKVQNQSSEDTFFVLGGDTLLVNNPAKWTESINNPRLWAVIEKKDMHSTIDLLDDPLRTSVQAFWDKMHVGGTLKQRPIASLEVPAQTSSKAGFLLASLKYRDDKDVGSVTIWCSKNASPKDDKECPKAEIWVNTSHGAHHDNHQWRDISTFCMPVPLNYKYVTEAWLIDRNERQGLGPQSRFAMVDTDLELGDWEPVQAGPGASKKEAGFLVVHIFADPPDKEGCIATAKAFVGGELVSSNSFHWWQSHRNWVRTAALCTPVPAGVTCNIQVLDTGTGPDCTYKAWWFPIKASSKYTLGETVKLKVINYPASVTTIDNTRDKHVPETDTFFSPTSDGFLSGFIAVNADGDRGIIRIFNTGDNDPQPLAGAATYLDMQRNRQINSGAVMLPVLKGETYVMKLAISKGSPAVSMFFTPIVAV